jgi:hypothetical protein
MKGKIDFECFAVEDAKKEGGKARWTRIGVAFVNKDSITVRLNALPINGEVVLLKPKPKEEAPPQKLNVFGG